MCELMGLSFDRPMSADFSIRAFALRDVENADGWGLGWYPDQSLSVVKEALTWRKSGYSKFLETYHGLNSRTYIAHVRHKTIGGLPTHADTHPFQRELMGREYCFAHNGTVDAFSSLPFHRFHPVGTTDSEQVFCHVLDLLAERGEHLRDESGWRWLHATLRRINQTGSLNCLLTDGDSLFAYRDLNGWKGLSLRKIRFRDKDERIFEDSTMEVTMAGEAQNHGFVVATCPLTSTGWHDFVPGQLTVLQNGGLRYSSATPALVSQP
jgi:glutamine amidotransferase